MLALQGGGALGAYQVGVYQAMHEAGIEPDWVIGNSIGAINGAVIVGNEPQRRLDQIARFWELLASPPRRNGTGPMTDAEHWWSCLAALMQGVGGFFRPNPAALCGPKAPLGAELAARMPERELESARVRALVASGCRTTMHIVQLRAPPAAKDAYAMDVDFTSYGVRSHWQAGYADTCRAIAQAP